MALLRNISIKRMGVLVFVTVFLAAILWKVCRLLIGSGIYDSHCDYFGNALLLCTALGSILYCYYSREELKQNEKLWLIDKGVYILSLVLILCIFGFATMKEMWSYRVIPSVLGVAGAGSLFIAVFFCLTRYFKNMRWNLFVLFCLWISLFIVIFFVPDSETINYYDIFRLFRGYNDMYAMKSFLWFVKIVIIETLLYILSFTRGKLVNEKKNEYLS